MNPKKPIEPDLIKALVASESGCNPKAWNGLRGSARARGLLQVTDKSLRYLAENQSEPALESAIGEVPHWESFNEWQCFPAAAAEINRYDQRSGKAVEEISLGKRDSKEYFPTITVEFDGKIDIFEAPGWVNLDQCQKKTTTWKNLIDRQTDFCVFTSKLPPSDQTIKAKFNNWVIYGLKSPIGRVLAPIYDPEAVDESSSGSDSF